VAVADVTAGMAPLTINFDASGSTPGDGTIVSWGWDFGDTNSGSGETTSHIFINPGNYTVTLTVTDDNSETGTDTIAISVTGPPELTVSYPDGGESFTGNQSIDITWTSAFFTGQVDIEFYDGTTWNVVADNEDDDGSYTWMVTNADLTGCAIKVSDAADGDPFDESDTTFSVTFIIDTDMDGLDDDWELTYFSDVADCAAGEDSDGDGLTNAEEYALGTNPVDPDTDGDGYSDGGEVDAGTDPLDAASHPDAGGPFHGNGGGSCGGAGMPGLAALLLLALCGARRKDNRRGDA
jgi:PKD repeat protein